MLAPFNVNVPDPAFIMFPDPIIFPENVLLELLFPIVILALPMLNCLPLVKFPSKPPNVALEAKITKYHLLAMLGIFEES